MHPTDAAIAYGGTQDNGTQRRQVNAQSYRVWQEFSAGDGGHCVINPSDTSIIFPTYVQCDVRRYTNNGGTFGANGNNATFGEPANARVSFFPPLVGNGVNSTLYFGTWRLFVNTSPATNISSAAAWVVPTSTPANQDLTKGVTSIGPDVLSAIGVGHQAWDNQQEIYTGSSQGRVMASTNGGGTFVDAMTGLPNRSVTSITIHPANSATAFITFSGFSSGHVFKTTNFGQSWTNISGNLADIPVNTFLIDPLNSGTYYVGTDIGVFRSTDGGTNWESFNNGLPPVIVNALVAQASGVIHAATFGRGAYELVPSNHSVSGRVRLSNGSGIPGVTITLSGGASATTTTDNNGNYTLVNVPGGQTSTVTPTKSGHNFSPASQNVNPVNGDITLNDFVGTPPTPVVYTFTGNATSCNPNADPTNWNDPCNWDPSGVPTENDYVVIIDNYVTARNVTVRGLAYNATLTGTFNVTDTAIWAGGELNGVLKIASGATLAINGDEQKGLVGNINGNANEAGRLENAGTTTWTGTGAIFAYNGAYANGVYVSSIINTGTFIIENDEAISGTGNGFFINTGILRKINSVNDTLIGDGVSLRNSGPLDIQSGFLLLRGAQHELNPGTQLLGAGRVFHETDGSVSVSGIFLGDGTFELGEGGSLKGAATFGGDITFKWTGGTIYGVPTVGSGATMLISGNSNKSIDGFDYNGNPNNAGRIQNQGTATWTGTGNIISLNGTYTNGVYVGSIVNNGTFTAQNDQQFTNGGYFVNNGTFKKSSSTGTTSIEAGTVFNQNGTITLSSGILSLGQGFNPAASSVLNLTLGGDISGTGFSQLDAGPSAALNGTINVSLANNFSSAIGSTFPLLLFGSRSGTFSHVNPPAINWRTFSVVYNSGDFSLQVAAPPTFTVPTAPGANVRVTGGGVALVFDNVTGSTTPQGGKSPLTGVTTITPIDPNSAGTAPSGFIITQDSIAYEITTTATYTGTIRVDIPLTTALQSIRPQLGLLHGEAGSLVDHTIATNSLTTISARVTSLSPFVVAQTVGCVSSIVPAGQPAGAPAVQSFASNGGSSSISVSSAGGCNWTASTSDNWITITSLGSGTGSGTVTYSVAANAASTIRSGSIIISGQRFTILQGIDFADVPVGSLFYNEIGRLSARGVTLGCGGGNYCPNQLVLRDQMAAFIVRALGDFNPPAPPTQRFGDVPPSNAFYGFIDEMAVRQITLGCGAGNYCPSDPVLREQMAAFLIRALGEFDPPTPATQRFVDAPPSSPFYKFIDRMAVLQITLGCSPTQYCPHDSVTRAQMAAFLVRAFKL